MKLLLAPDSFKGSLSAQRFCQVAAAAIAEICPEADCTSLPLADGGEGSLDAFASSNRGMRLERLSVQDPLGRPVAARYGWNPAARLGFVELAEASGLALLAADERDPLRASTYGTGQVIAHLLDLGATRLIVALGGSASNDGGAGILAALGYELFDAAGLKLARGGLALASLGSVRSERVHRRYREVDLVLATDVTNPLLGPNGASVRYGPQKGATEANVLQLEGALRHWADQLELLHAGSWRHHPGSGAAGGAGFALLSQGRARVVSGFDLLADALGLVAHLAAGDIDFIISGEGCMDAGTHSGKLLSRLAAMAARHKVPLLAFTGGLSDSWAQGEASPWLHAVPLLSRPMTEAEAIARVESLLTAAIKRTLRLILTAREGF